MSEVSLVDTDIFKAGLQSWKDIMEIYMGFCVCNCGAYLMIFRHPTEDPFHPQA